MPGACIRWIDGGLDLDDRTEILRWRFYAFISIECIDLHLHAAGVSKGFAFWGDLPAEQKEDFHSVRKGRSGLDDWVG